MTINIISVKPRLRAFTDHDIRCQTIDGVWPLPRALLNQYNSARAAAVA